MRYLTLGLVALLSFTGCSAPEASAPPADSGESIWSIDFIRTLPGAQGDYVASIETNWASSRHIAVDRGAVRSYRAFVAPQDSLRGWDVVLMTEYADSTSFANREAIFQEIFASPDYERIEPARPSPDMREILFSVEMESFVSSHGAGE